MHVSFGISLHFGVVSSFGILISRANAHVLTHDSNDFTCRLHYTLNTTHHTLQGTKRKASSLDLQLNEDDREDDEKDKAAGDKAVDKDGTCCIVYCCIVLWCVLCFVSDVRGDLIRWRMR